MAVPYIQQQAGVPITSDADLQAGRNQATALNGSGPNDPDGAMKAPDGFLGMLLGRRLDGSGNASYGIPWGLLVIGALLIGGFILLRRR